MAGMEIASLFAKVGADVGDFNKAMKGVHGDLTNAEGATNKFADVAGAAFKAVAVAALAVGAAVAAMVATSVTAAADMEQGIADIGAMMSLTSEETDKLQAHIMDLGLDPQLKVSATEASAAVMALGTAGASVTDIIGGMSEATVLLANATGLKGENGFATAATIASDVMAQFGISAGEMSKAVDQVTGTTVVSKFGIDDYRLAVGQAGGVAAAVGVTFDDFNAIIAATSPNFTSGSDAGTSYKTFLQRLEPTTNTAKDAMRELGLWTEESGSAFFDATGKMKSAEEIAGVLDIAFSGLSDAQRISAASTIFGTDAMRTALSLADGGTAIITKMKKEIGKVDAEELAKKRMDTLKGSWEIFQGVVETLQLKLGQKFLPVAKLVVDWTTDMATKYGPKLISFFDTLLSPVSLLIVRLTNLDNVTNPLRDTFMSLWDNLKKVTDIITTMLKPIVDVIAKYVTWKDVLIGLGILLAGPVLGAIGGVIAGLVSFAAPIAAVIAAVSAMRFAWEQDFYGIRTFVLSSLQKMSDWFFKESGLWKGNWKDTWENIKTLADRLIRIDLYNLIVGTWAQIKFHIQQATIVTRDTIVAWVEKINKEVTHWESVAGYTFRHTRDLIIQYWNEWTGPTIKAISDWSARTVSQINTWVQYWKEKLQPWYDWVIEKFQAVFDWWDDNIQPWIDTATAVVTGWWGEIEKQWKLFDKWWRDTWTGTVDWVKNLLGIASPSKVFESIGADLMAGLTNGIDAAKQAPLNAIESLTSQVQTKMEGMVTKVANSAQTIRDQINNMPALPQGYWSTPTTPTTPTAPVVTPPVIAPPMPGNTPVVTHGGVDFGAKLLSNGLNMIASFVDTSSFMSDIASFANSVKTLLTTNGQTLASSGAEAQAIRDLTGPGLDSRRVNDVLNMLQLLVQEIRERGLVNQLNLSMAPDAALAQQTELEALVAFLNSRMNG